MHPRPHQFAQQCVSVHVDGAHVDHPSSEMQTSRMHQGQLSDVPSPGSTCAVRKLDLLCTLLAVRPNMRDSEGGGGS